MTVLKGGFLLLDISLPLKDPVPIFSLVLFIILLAPIILRKFRIPSIIGLIIAGMAIGDHGFKIIEKGSIDLFGKAGLLYIMFLAGLELDMTEFRKNRHRSLVFGAAFLRRQGVGVRRHRKRSQTRHRNRTQYFCLNSHPWSPWG